MREGDYQGSRRYRRHLSIVVCLLLVFVLGTTVAHAITIVIDGDRDAIWDGDGVQEPGSTGDSNEGDITDNVDIEQFMWTNDKDNMYFMIDVHAAAPFMQPLAVIDICLDTDDSAATDIHPALSTERDRCSYDTGVTGIDVIVEAYRLPNGTLMTDVYDATVSPTVWLGAGVTGYNPSATIPVVEISVPLDLLGLSSGSCAGDIPMVAYYDGGDSNPDDNLPDSGTTTITCGSPTAVSMHSASAVANSPVSSNALLAGLVLTIVSGGVILRRERHA